MVKNMGNQDYAEHIRAAEMQKNTVIEQFAIKLVYRR